MDPLRITLISMILALPLTIFYVMDEPSGYTCATTTSDVTFIIVLVILLLVTLIPTWLMVKKFLEMKKEGEKE